jgi:hypothetical protein
MKLYIFILLLLPTTTCFAQNYDCLQYGAKNYFLNGNGYVRGMRIDSVRTVGSDVIYYPYRTRRISNYIYTDTLYWGGYRLDSLGASWLGKKVIKHSDGTFLFDNMWDTVTIKSQAHTGDSWPFFNDATRYSYQATVTSEGVMTVAGGPDSIKTITITADSSGVPHINDPVNNFQIVLSKNHGFVQTFDLYTFPYHRRDTVGADAYGVTFYLRYFDYYLDVLLNNLGTCDLGPCPDNIPDTINSIFRLFPFHNPRNTEIYDFAVGDVYESYFSAWNPGSSLYEKYTLDTVATKLVAPYTTSYTGPEHTKLLLTELGHPPTITFASGSYSAIADTNFLIDPNKLPEEQDAGFLLHYYDKYLPGEVNCDSPASYVLDKDYHGSGFASNGFQFIPSFDNSTYTIGYGLSGKNNFIAVSGASQIQYYNYYHKNSLECGRFVSMLDKTAVASVDKPGFISISPNPATDHINISSTQPADNSFICIYDMTGKCIYRSNEPMQNVLTINTAAWMDGLYMVVIQNADGIVKKEKIVIRK